MIIMVVILLSWVQNPGMKLFGMLLPLTVLPVLVFEFRTAALIIACDQHKEIIHPDTLYKKGRAIIIVHYSN